MFDNFDGYAGQVISQEALAEQAQAEPVQSPEEISANIINDAQTKAAQIIAAAEERAEQIASEGLLGQIMLIETEKQRQLDQAVGTLTGLVGDVVEDIIGKQPASGLAGDVFKAAIKKFNATDTITVEAASDVFPRLQLLARIDQSRNPDRLKVLEKANLEKGKIIIVHGEQRFYADAASQIETFRRAVMGANDQSRRAS